ncbi:TPA: hypothetical protein ACWV6N_003581 [Salmonella enterica subsp. enterica serovar Muenchen]
MNGKTMRRTGKPISLEQAEYKTHIASLLYEIILEKVDSDIYPDVCNLLYMVCDINQEVYRALLFVNRQHITDTNKGGGNE